MSIRLLLLLLMLKHTCLCHNTGFLGLKTVDVYVLKFVVVVLKAAKNSLVSTQF